MNSSLRETVTSSIVFLPRSSLHSAKPRMEVTLNQVGFIPEGGRQCDMVLASRLQGLLLDGNDVSCA